MTAAPITPRQALLNEITTRLQSTYGKGKGTLDGKPVRLRIPPLTQNGQVFRLKGYGMPKVGQPQEKGDLYARVEAQRPS